MFPYPPQECAYEANTEASHAGCGVMDATATPSPFALPNPKPVWQNTPSTYSSTVALHGLKIEKYIQLLDSHG